MREEDSARASTDDSSRSNSAWINAGISSVTAAALREAGYDLRAAQVRDAEVVERYEQWTSGGVPCAQRELRSRPCRKSDGSQALRRLEELDDVAGRIFDQDLLATRAGHDLVAKADVLRLELFDLGFDVIHLDDEAVPSPGAGWRPSGIGRAAEL